MYTLVFLRKNEIVRYINDNISKASDKIAICPPSVNYNTIMFIIDLGPFHRTILITLYIRIM